MPVETRLLFNKHGYCARPPRHQLSYPKVQPTVNLNRPHPITPKNNLRLSTEATEEVEWSTDGCMSTMYDGVKMKM